MAKSNTEFWAKYRDPRWQKKRLEVMECSGWECQNCGEKGQTLNVHHKRYVKNRDPWDYPIHELSCLCEPCHEEVTEHRAELNNLIAAIDPCHVDTIVGVAAGYLDACMCIEDPGDAYGFRETRPMHYELGVVAAVAEGLGVNGWRALVRDIAAKRPTTPVVHNLVREWDDDFPKA